MKSENAAFPYGFRARGTWRFEIALDVLVKGKRGVNAGLTTKGRTREISSSAVALATHTPLRAGDDVELSIQWPATLGNACRLKLVVFGTVVKQAGQNSTVQIRKYEFRTARLAAAL